MNAIALNLAARRDLQVTTLAACLVQAAAQPDDRAQLRTLRRQLVWPMGLVAAMVTAWAQLAPLSGAVVASGQVQAEFGRKTVQHQEGGIVQRLLVHEGQAVKRGDALLVVGDLRSDAALAVLRGQREAEALRAARAAAELALAAAPRWPDAADAAAVNALQRERQLFDARRRALDEQLAAQQQQLGELRARETALRAQLEAGERAATLAHDELELNRPLVKEGFIQKTRLMGLERNQAELDGRSAAIRGQLADARAQAAALLQSMAQARGAYQQRAADEHKDASARLRELDDRLRPSQDTADRQTVRAPVDGVVMALRVGAAGTAVGPREPLLEIAPAGEGLVVEVPIAPHDIDHVRIGGAAELRLSAFDARRTPLLPATVRSVTPDALADAATQRRAFIARIEVSAADLARQPGLRLQAGMPAEVFITTPARSLVDYLLEPLGGFARRGLREP